MRFSFQAVEDIDVKVSLANNTDKLTFRTIAGSKVLGKTSEGERTMRFELQSEHDHSIEQIVILKTLEGGYLYKASFMDEPHEYYDIGLKRVDGDYMLVESEEAPGDHVTVELYCSGT